MQAFWASSSSSTASATAAAQAATDPKQASGKYDSDGSASDGAALQTAQERIKELEGQIKILTLRATSAVERATEYETALKRLTAKTEQSAAASTATPSADASSDTSEPPPTTASRLARLLTTRYTSASPAPNQQAAPAAAAAAAATAAVTASTSDAALRDALTHEQSLRRAAESAAAKTNSEIEELTAQLFEQANEMVAAERKARARLESRVEMLEKRDSDKARRLGLLEMRIQRVERVRSLLTEKQGPP